MKTDLQKFQKFFNEMNIQYHIYTDEMRRRYIVSIDDVNLAVPWCSALNVLFDYNESFINFEAFSDD